MEKLCNTNPPQYVFFHNDNFAATVKKKLFIYIYIERRKTKIEEIIYFQKYSTAVAYSWN